MPRPGPRGTLGKREKMVLVIYCIITLVAVVLLYLGLSGTFD